MLRAGFSFLLDILFPRRCAGCGVAREVLCAACLAHWSNPHSACCSVCGGRQPFPLGRRGFCHKTADYVLLAGARYEDSIVREILRYLKFDRREVLGGFLGERLAQIATTCGINFDVVIPIPLSQRRLRERGFNQAASIARPIAQVLRVPCSEGLLVRTRHTNPQTLCSWSIRASNLIGAFGVTSKEAVRGARILLVDDVSTSGATLREAARALKAAGAASVTALVAARAG